MKRPPTYCAMFGHRRTFASSFRPPAPLSAPRMAKASWAETWKSFRDSIWGLMLVVIIIGGIYSGLFTATEVLELPRPVWLFCA